MKKILVVDNDRIFLKFMTKLLEKEGHQVVTAGDGLIALDALRTFGPDIIFVDLVMPNIDGQTFCKIIRKKPEFKDTYLAILSAIAAEEKVDIARIGADACIAKGSFEEMAQYILTVIEQPERSASQCLDGEVLGIQSIYPRGITAELLTSKKRFQIVLEKMSEGIIELNSERRVIYANPKALFLTGQAEDALLGAYIVDLFSDKDRKQVREAFERKGRLTEGKTTNVSVILNSQKVSLNIIPFDEFGSMGVIITDRVQVEEDLMYSERKYRDLFENVSDFLYFHDLDGVFTETNLAFIKDYGYKVDDLVNLNIKDLMPERYKDQFEDYLKKIRANGKDEGLITVKIRDGSERILEYKSSLIYENNVPVGIRGSARDITKRIKAEQAMRESEEKYRSILNSIEEGYFEVDLGGNLTFFNKSLTKIAGYAEDELIGKNNREYTSPETAKKVFKIFNDIYRTGKPRRIDNYEVLRKNGEKVTFEVSASLIRGPEGEPVGFRGVVYDISERLQSEEERKKLEVQLRQSQKMEAVGTLAGGIAHDFNNLMMGIQGNTSLMLMDTDSSHPHFEKLENIEQYVQIGSDLTGQLLGFAQSGRYEVRSVDINKLVQSSSGLFGRTKKEIRVKTIFQENIWAVGIDHAQIEQVLLNIYVNAWQAMPGGGDLYIETKNVYLDNQALKTIDVKPGNFIRISIRDTGIGMDEKTQQKIFEPFFTTKKMSRGTGLGLASAYGIIMRHGGFIDVQSKKGAGTTFNIFLPESKKEPVEEKKPAEEVIRGTEAILLVDDEEMIIDVGGQLLEAMGYAVLSAMSGQEAVEKYRQYRSEIDMVILDMIMPGMSGGKTYDELKKINPDLKILLASGYSMDGEATEILNRGCDGFIQKPFKIKHLSRKIREVLGDT